MRELQTSRAVVLLEKRRKLSREKEERHKVTFICMKVEKSVDHLFASSVKAQELEGSMDESGNMDFGSPYAAVVNNSTDDGES